MSISAEQEEAIYDVCSLRDLAIMCGAMPQDLSVFISKITAEILVPLFCEINRQRKTYVPCTDGRRSKIDWSKATPRPDEFEWLRLKASVFRRDGYVCTYCGERDTKFTADHVVLLSRGGTNELDNLVACCIPCNNSKRHLLISEWRGRL